MVRLAEFVLRHRRLVMLFWLVMFVVGIGAASQVTDRLTVDFSLPGQPGYETEKQLLDTFGNGGSNPPTIAVVTVPKGTTVKDQMAKITPVFDAIDKALPGTRMVDYAQTNNDVFLTDDGRTTYALVYPKPFESFTDVGPDVAMKPILAQASKDTGFDFGVTGYNLLAQGTDDPEGRACWPRPCSVGSVRWPCCCSCSPRSSRFVPLLIAAVSILTTFTIVLLGTYVTDISFVVQFLIALVGLGVAVDYSLLVVNRWREERAHGRDNHDAVVIAMQYAGHAVVASAGTVAISLCALLVDPGAAAAQHGHRRHADPAGQHRRHPHPAAGAAGRHRAAGRLAADPARGQAARGPGRPGRGSSSAGAGSRAGVALVILGALIIPDLRHQDRPGADQLAGQRRPGLRAAADAARRRRPRRHRVADGGAGQGKDPAGSAEHAADRAAKVDGVAAAFAPDTPQWRTGRRRAGRRHPDRRRPSTRPRRTSSTTCRARSTGPRCGGHRRRRPDGARLHQRGLQEVPLQPRADRAGDVHPAGAHVPLDRAADQGGAAQHHLGQRDVRRDRAVLAGGPRVGGGVRHRADRRGDLLAAGADLRVPVRPVDGLRGVHPGPDARGVRQERRHRPRPSSPGWAAPVGS